MADKGPLERFTSFVNSYIHLDFGFSTDDKKPQPLQLNSEPAHTSAVDSLLSFFQPKATNLTLESTPHPAPAPTLPYAAQIPTPADINRAITQRTVDVIPEHSQDTLSQITGVFKALLNTPKAPENKAETNAINAAGRQAAAEFKAAQRTR